MKTLSMSEAASHLGVSRSTFWRMRKDRPLKTIPGYRRERVEVGELEKWLLDEQRILTARAVR